MWKYIKAFYLEIGDHLMNKWGKKIYVKYKNKKRKKPEAPKTTIDSFCWS